MTNRTVDFASLLPIYASAVLAKDSEALKSLYHPEVIVFDAWGRWAYRDRTEWGAAIAAWLGSLGTERVRVEFEVASAGSDANVAWLQAFVDYIAIDGQGQRLKSLTHRLSWVGRFIEGRWLVVHEHTSAPAEFETKQIMLARRPGND